LQIRKISDQQYHIWRFYQSAHYKRNTRAITAKIEIACWCQLGVINISGYNLQNNRETPGCTSFSRCFPFECDTVIRDRRDTRKQKFVSVPQLFVGVRWLAHGHACLLSTWIDSHVRFENVPVRASLVCLFVKVQPRAIFATLRFVTRLGGA